MSEIRICRETEIEMDIDLSPFGDSDGVAALRGTLEGMGYDESVLSDRDLVFACMTAGFCGWGFEEVARVMIGRAVSPDAVK